MAEKEQTHRHILEEKEQADIRELTRLGQWLGLTVSLVGLGAAVYLGVGGHEVTGSVIGGGTIVSLVAIFVIRKK
jgi:uncharacterized membrane protein